MSEQALQTQLEKMLQLHEELLALSQQKTEAVKKGDMENLQQILKQEQKLILELDRAEKERQAASQTIVPLVENPALEDCLPYLSHEQQDRLSNLKERLKAVIAQIEIQNNLNYELIQQSLQFIHVSLNLFRPKEESINYGPPKGHKPKVTVPAGMFQTKA
ncbi:FlgN protein [Bacillus oleivorans]|uniref:FlgN protein n=1 Tax=Bacillus oleivorans TaxID=1448271 RepID=A0A285D0V4_9BACI|nr:flagellar protein FlgN [Bacillus oleivorans]SNX72926.1 FlgN protein [Bacillus oleivorans]